MAAYSDESSGMAIGGAVSGGTSGKVLFVNSSGNLAQGDVTWDDTNKRLGGASSSYLELGSNIVLHKGDGRDISMIGGGVITSGNTYTQLAGRFLPGTATVASAGNLTLPLGSIILITGTTNINYFGDTTQLTTNTPYELRFAGALTVLHNGGAPPANHAPFQAVAGANLATTAGMVIRVLWDGTNLVQLKGN